MMLNHDTRLFYTVSSSREDKKAIPWADFKRGRRTPDGHAGGFISRTQRNPTLNSLTLKPLLSFPQTHWMEDLGFLVLQGCQLA